VNRKQILVGLFFLGVIALLTACVTQNVAPTASFTTNVTGGPAPLAVSFDASASNDPDGTIASYTWSFGDGQNGEGVSGTHIYMQEGIYTAILTVVDDSGALATASWVVTVTAPENESPTATFSATPNSGEPPLNVMFNASESEDTDGTISSYDWDFGDGSAHGSGVAVVHTYTSSGSYQAILTVTDDNEEEDTITHTITVTSPANSLPTASFTTDPAFNVAYAKPPVTVDFDAGSSSDADGTITSYNWIFGDGETATGVTTAHTYNASGKFTIILTVIDDQGAPASATKSITIMDMKLPIDPYPIFDPILIYDM